MDWLFAEHVVQGQDVKFGSRRFPQRAAAGRRATGDETTHKIRRGGGDVAFKRPTHTSLQCCASGAQCRPPSSVAKRVHDLCAGPSVPVRHRENNLEANGWVKLLLPITNLKPNLDPYSDFRDGGPSLPLLEHHSNDECRTANAGLLMVDGRHHLSCNVLC